ncbi:mitochondrial trans-2-enoyl-CoA reductase [Naegleria gruberi]|uniref:Enoyl-[acyl-carrier-protein] reductase, mitochondrial n=1 Tax=Naegleria gruberi TaxID=5762 RepID=D2VNA9_NAEGR|nr:mitochondrial trans-2-enoyl-CoA reductase [Naegleria gruberi]EFC41710.1 mitochondrial trans-2-enoyl-CoA reductase [Naegleria gruberi]|eukprot:XP_002674454.1 mitochondrial trans-2-enoyl-CoA reductase [Naegleria gruberi strain NEG-M]
MRKSIQSLARINNTLSFAPRNCFYATVQSKAVRYEKFGNPLEVLKVENVDIDTSVKNDEVVIKMLAAPINPADINTIQGVYGKSPKSFPAVPGNEGVGIVEEVGSGVTGLKKGDHVIPSNGGLGTWRTHLVCKAEDVTTVPKELPVEYASILSVNPCTAYRLLSDFAELKPGDVIIQNGANSMVGLMVIQLAKLRGIQTINLIRQRQNHDLTVQRMKQLGADIVMDYSFASNNTKMSRLLSDLPKPKLALNCVGGDAARIVTKYLAEDGVMVTYGGMSRQGITVPTSPFIFNNITLKGFWMTRWVETHSKEERQKMIDELSKLVIDKKLLALVETHKFSEFNYALEKSFEDGQERKVVLKMNE